MLLLFLFFDIFVQCTKKLSFFLSWNLCLFCLPSTLLLEMHDATNKNWHFAQFGLAVFYYYFGFRMIIIKKNETTMNESIPGDFYFISFSVLVWLQRLVWHNHIVGSMFFSFSLSLFPDDNVIIYIHNIVCRWCVMMMMMMK